MAVPRERTPRWVLAILVIVVAVGAAAWGVQQRGRVADGDVTHVRTAAEQRDDALLTRVSRRRDVIVDLRVHEQLTLLAAGTVLESPPASYARGRCPEVSGSCVAGPPPWWASRAPGGWDTRRQRALLHAGKALVADLPPSPPLRAGDLAAWRAELRREDRVLDGWLPEAGTWDAARACKELAWSAADAGVILRTCATTAPPRRRDFYDEIPVRAEMLGDPCRIEECLQAASRPPGMLTVAELRATTTPGGERAEMTLVTFAWRPHP